MDFAVILEMQRIMRADAGDQSSNTIEALKSRYGIGTVPSPTVMDYAPLIGIPAQQQNNNGMPTAVLNERQLELLANCHHHNKSLPTVTTTIVQRQTSPITTNTVVTEPCNLSALLQHIYTTQSQQKLQQQQQHFEKCNNNTTPTAPIQTPAERTTSCTNSKSGCSSGSFSSAGDEAANKNAEILMVGKKLEEQRFLNAPPKICHAPPEAMLQLNQQQQQMQLIMQQLLQLYGTKFTRRSAFTVPNNGGQQVQAVSASTAEIALPHSFENVNKPAEGEECRKTKTKNNLVLIRSTTTADQADQLDGKLKQCAMPAAVSHRPTLSSSPTEMPTAATTEVDNDSDANATTVDEYVDVVGDGAEGRSSQMRQQRKAHIEFYRKLKSLRSRGPTLECQQCGQLVANTDACTRSHLHAHCDVALFVCKLCQRGFADQHLVFEHINTEHPTKKGTQCIEDRRDMFRLMQLLADCFPRVMCKTKDAMQEHLVRLLVDSRRGGAAQCDEDNCVGLRCQLCKMDVPADRATLHAHLNTHPAFRCKKCKFVSKSLEEQKVHQRVEHGLEEDASTNLGQQPYCVSSALEVQFDTLRACFPLSRHQQQQQHQSTTPGTVEEQQQQQCCINNNNNPNRGGTGDATKTTRATAASRRRKTHATVQQTDAAGGVKRKRSKDKANDQSE